MNVLNLDGSKPGKLKRGKQYLVPSFANLPVVYPSHIDLERTGLHYHIDNRFRHESIPIAKFYEETIGIENIKLGDRIWLSIIRDDGRELQYQTFECVKYSTMSGELFSALAWLYLTYGQDTIKNNTCPHHGTQLSVEEDCLKCPAHGLKFKKNGEPRYQPPFYLKINNDTLLFDSLSINYKLEMGWYDIKLVDSNNETISQITEYVDCPQSGLNIEPWPIDGPCPRLK